MALKLAYSLFNPSNLVKSSIPVIITHSLYGHRGNWVHIAQNLAQKTQSKVYTLDARNHGESPRASYGSFLDMADDMLKFIDDHGIERCHLLGHSMGGLTSIPLALNQRSRIKSLVVVDISPIGVPKSMLAANLLFTKAMRNIMKQLHSQLSLEMAREICDKELEQMEMPESMRRVFASTICKDGKNFICLTNLDVLEKRFEIDMYPSPEIKGYNNLPTLFIRGEKPTYLKVEHEPEIVKFFPHAKFEYIDGATHQVHLDRPEELLESYLRFYHKEANVSRV